MKQAFKNILAGGPSNSNGNNGNSKSDSKTTSPHTSSPDIAKSTPLKQSSPTPAPEQQKPPNQKGPGSPSPSPKQQDPIINNNKNSNSNSSASFSNHSTKIDPASVFQPTPSPLGLGMSSSPSNNPLLRQLHPQSQNHSQSQTPSLNTSAVSLPHQQQQAILPPPASLLPLPTTHQLKEAIRDTHSQKDTTHSNSTTATAKDPTTKDSTTTQPTAASAASLFPFHKEHYRFLKTLGSGSYAMVKEAVYVPTGERVAVKMIEKARMRHREDRLRCEIEILTKVHHRNLLRLLDWGMGRQTIYLVTELAQGGELFDCIIQNGHFFEQDAARIIYTIFEAVEHLHDLNIVHRDLKPENIFMRDPNPTTDYTNLVIGDFGIARIMDASKPFLQTKIGSGGYMAPEVLMGRPYGRECDVWSVGVIAYILLSGSVPYRGQDFATELQHILTHPVAFEDDIWSTISEEAKDLITGCMQIHPHQRITASQSLSHLWFEVQFHEDTTTGRDLLPSLRGTIDQERAMRELSDRMGSRSLLVTGDGVDASMNGGNGGNGHHQHIVGMSGSQEAHDSIHNPNNPNDNNTPILHQHPSQQHQQHPSQHPSQQPSQPITTPITPLLMMNANTQQTIVGTVIPCTMNTSSSTSTSTSTMSHSTSNKSTHNTHDTQHATVMTVDE